MKKILVIFCIGIHLFTTTELREFIKLPMLVEHYLEHQSHNGHETLIDFLAMHYMQDNLKDADFDKDQRLPFKSHEGCINLSVLICIPQLSETQVALTPSGSSEWLILPKISFISSDHLSNIWQPPRFI